MEKETYIITLLALFCEFGLETYIKNTYLCIVVFTTKVAQDAHVPITHININKHMKNTSLVDQPLNEAFNVIYSKFFKF